MKETKKSHLRCARFACFFYVYRSDVSRLDVVGEAHFSARRVEFGEGKGICYHMEDTPLLFLFVFPEIWGIW